MLRFIAYIWDTANTAQREEARMLCQQLVHDPELSSVFEHSGIAVFACGFRRRSTECYKLQNRGGVVLGTLFGRDANPDVRGAGAVTLDDSRSARIVASEGRELVESYWGRYVAWIRDPESGRVWVVQDPSAGLSVYRMTVRGVHAYFSEQADCARLTGVRFNVDWQYMGAQAYLPILASDTTALEGVSELLGGQCDLVSGGRVVTRPYWRPSSFALCRLDDEKDAEAALLQVVKGCVHVWAGCYTHLLHQYSGGLDSSVGLGCLQDAPTRPKVTCLTFHGRGAGVDERSYAQIGVESAKCDWLQLLLDESATFQLFARIPPAPRPGVYLPCLQERLLMATARKVGATAISTGNGGDALFGEMKDARIPGDYLRDHGARRDFFRVVMSTAQLTQTSVTHVMRNSLASFWSRSVTNPTSALHLKFAKLVSQGAVDAVVNAPGRYAHAWVRDAAGLPPCKVQHIAMMSQPMTVRTLLAERNDPEHVHFLATQKGMEVCAATPTYVFTAGGRTRAVARAAFKSEVSPALLARQSKGNPSSFVRDLVAANSADVREVLLGGQLVQHGILDKRRVERALTGQATDVSGSEILRHVCAEYWLRAQGGLQSWAAAA